MRQTYWSDQNQNKLQAIASGFVVISRLDLELYLNLENRVQFRRKTFSKRRKERILMEQFSPMIAERLE